MSNTTNDTPLSRDFFTSDEEIENVPYCEIATAERDMVSAALGHKLSLFYIKRWYDEDFVAPSLTQTSQEIFPREDWAQDALHEVADRFENTDGIYRKSIGFDDGPESGGWYELFFCEAGNEAKVYEMFRARLEDYKTQNDCTKARAKKESEAADRRKAQSEASRAKNKALKAKRREKKQ